MSEIPIRQASLASQLEQILRKQILDGVYPANSKFPPENILAEEYQVSRSTVRSALDALAGGKLLIRRQGVGTYVSQISRVSNPLNNYMDFGVLIASSGWQPGFIRPQASVIEADEELAKMLQIEVGERILSERKIFTADDVPVIYTHNYIPVRIFRHLYSIDEAIEKEITQPFFDFFTRCGEKIEYAIADLKAEIARKCDGFEEMKVEPELPVMVFEEISYSQSEKPVVFSQDIYLSNRMSFSLIRRVMPD
jgi:GntR family transcriptional regulator